MKEIVFENQKYKEFENSDEGNAWGWKFFSDVLTPKDNPAYESVFFYTGSMYSKWNAVLRRHPTIESGMFEISAKGEFAADGEQLRRILEVDSVLKHHIISENIVVYRYTHKNVVKKLCATKILKKGMQFADKAFLSTTLVRHLLNEFAKKHSCNCLLKIYLPRGINGAYVSVKNTLSTLNEQEILLARNVKLEIIKVHYLSRPMLIECKVV